MRRGIGTTALVAAIALAATACGSDDGDGGDGSGKDASGELSGTVTFWDTSNEAEKGVFETLAEDFEKKHPKVDVKYVNIGFDDAQNKFKNAANAGEAPEVMRTEVAWVSDFASLQLIEPLGDVVEDEDDYLPQAWGSTQYEGETYALPQVTDTLALFYNKELLKKAGVEVPTSIEELKNSADAIEDKAGVTPLYLRGDDSYWFLPYLYGEGGDLVDADAQKVTIGDPAGVAAFETVKDLLDSGVAETDLTDGYANQERAFNNGDVAMMVNGPWAIAGTLAGEEFKDNPDNLGVAPVFAGSKGQGAPQGGWNLSVYAGTAPENMDAAKAFAAYMSSPEVQQRTTEELSLLPTRTSVYEVDSVKGNQMVQFFKPAVDKAVQRAWIPQAASLFDPLNKELAKVIKDAASPKSAAESTAKEYRKLLEDWK
ncbi:MULTISPECIES: extracellular solute-binding protein [unclassified Streptomyces]|uniref:extracellular solute-binding protein n=1 Tax=unclassified Streptomyces TaxID=2593676 RepID=UPI0022B6EB22|nr:MULTISPECIES: extracellular solute-binding protein [unclassified Streptomyces]MCZ7413982.1 extracellular solute-binding protein [Streptomyces sp. WMMC897]MCZ7430978.1 extracellular solute-binding protein [Streptomyces sp. WMMC1477]